MKAAWTPNPNWDTPIKRELCGRVADRYISCQHEKPCSIHDSSPSEPGAFPLPSVSPAPRFFDPWEAE